MCKAFALTDMLGDLSAQISRTVRAGPMVCLTVSPDIESTSDIQPLGSNWSPTTRLLSKQALTAHRLPIH